MARRVASKGLTLKMPNPGISWAWIINLLVAVLKPILAVLTPMLREELEALLLKFYRKAEATPNPWDDFLAELLLKILGIPIPTA